MKRIGMRRVSVIIVSAALALTVLSAAIADEIKTSHPAAVAAPTGQYTVTKSTTPSTLATPFAKPKITGPALLPVEQRGLPGD